MDIPSNNQLIAYCPDQRRTACQTAKIAGCVAVFADRRLMRYNLLRPTDFPESIPLPDVCEPEYSADRRLKTPKIIQVGLLIDIYA